MTDDVKRLFQNRQQLVKDNMRNMLQATPQVPTIPSDDVLILRATLIMEETLETIAGLGVTLRIMDSDRQHAGWCMEVCKAANLEFKRDKPINIFEVVDGLADLDYVGPCGTAVAFGVDLDPIFQEVHRSNMTKCWTDEELGSLDPKEYQIGFRIHAAPVPQGDHKWVVLDALGKYIKSPSYSPANIRDVLALQFITE